jgi:hypothetical protein
MDRAVVDENRIVGPVEHRTKCPGIQPTVTVLTTPRHGASIFGPLVQYLGTNQARYTNSPLNGSGASQGQFCGSGNLIEFPMFLHQ